jgi:hypothetical protein
MESKLEKSGRILRKILDIKGWDADINQDDDSYTCKLRFAEDAEMGCRSIYTLYASDSFLNINSTNDRLIEERDWSKAILSCNRWNDDKGVSVFARVRFHEEHNRADFMVSSGLLLLPKSEGQIDTEFYAQSLLPYWDNCEEFWKFVHQKERIAQFRG